MQCAEARKKLLELVDGELDDAESTGVEDHLERCPDCETTYKSVRYGHDVLSRTIPRLAPQGPHLTEERFAALEQRVGQRDRRVVTTRRVLGTAAAAAVLVAFLFVYQDVQRWMSPPDPDGAQHAAGPSDQYIQNPRTISARYRLSSLPSTGGQDVVSGIVQKEVDASASNTNGATILRTSTPGLQVPVQNTLYDPEQDGYWW
jgi:anti-sigma factor RsiW